MDHVTYRYEWSFDLDHFRNNHSGAPDGVQNRIENGAWHVLDFDGFNGSGDESYRLYADRRGLAHLVGSAAYACCWFYHAITL